MSAFADPQQIMSIIGNFNSFDEFWTWLQENEPSAVNMGASLWNRLYNTIHARMDAEQTGDWQNVLMTAGENAIELNPLLEKGIDNAIANQRTEEARSFEEYMRDTEFTSAASQLQSIGLSPSAVVQTGGASSNGVAAANSDMKNHSANMAMQKYQQRMQMARQVVGLAGQMASSGIYGSALGAARNSAAQLSSAAAHSGLNALKQHIYGKFDKNEFGSIDNKVGGFYSIFE